MDAGRWDAVKAMLHEALERPSEDRDAYLDAACAGDAALRAELASLVAAHDDDFLEVPAFAAAADALERGRRDDLAGGRVGPFRVVREIGRGGMGTVYLADRADGTYERRVALKVISRGMDTDLVVRRFRRERQILAGLDHPDIARLFSGGTTDDGRPYLVMEYVEGEPIDVYCARHALGIPERLALFRRVCGAVQYAHQRLVVHRDLKPGNILVAPDGAPKLLDFGIAKVLRPAGERTEATRRATTLHAMTPEYASPEQRAGEPVTTLSDVYSLGVLLHELLTGRHPGVDGPSGADPERPSVVVTRPPNGSLAPPGDPSTLRRALRGDLDTIVLKAMRHEPARRYASAEQLADDVRRHAERLPVLARPDTFRYRSGRFVRRHRAAVAAACLTTLSLLGAAGATARQASVARAAQGQAERRFAEVRELATSFLFELDSAMAPLPGTMATRELIVRRALRSLDGLAREAHDDPSLLRDLAEAYRKVGDVQGAPYIANLGHTADALASYRKSAAILERLARTTPGTAPNGRRARERLSSTYAAMSAVQARAGDVDGAVRAGRRAVALCDTLLRADPTNPRYRRLLAEALLFLGRATFLRHSEPTTYEALADYERALAMRDTMLAAAPLDPRARGAAAIMRAYASYAHWRLAELTADTSHYRAALVLLSSAHDLFALNARLRPDDLHARRDAVVPLREIAELHIRLDEPAAALRLLDESRPAMAALAAGDPHDAEAQRDLAAIDRTFAHAYAALHDAPRALAGIRRARAVLDRLRATDSTSLDDLESLGDLAATEGALARAAGDVRAAIASYERAEAIAREYARAAPDMATPQRVIAAEAATLAELHDRRGDHAACASLTDAADAWRRIASIVPFGHADSTGMARVEHGRAMACGPVAPLAARPAASHVPNG